MLNYLCVDICVDIWINFQIINYYLKSSSEVIHEII